MIKTSVLPNFTLARCRLSSFLPLLDLITDVLLLAFNKCLILFLNGPDIETPLEKRSLGSSLKELKAVGFLCKSSLIFVLVFELFKASEIKSPLSTIL